MDGRGDLIDEIEHDHARIERWFDELQRDVDRRDAVLPPLARLLIAHGRAISSIYPLIGAQLELPDLVSGHELRHAEISRLLSQLRYVESSSLEFDEVLQRLIDVHMLHVDEEGAFVPWLVGKFPRQRSHELGLAFALNRVGALEDRANTAARPPDRLVATSELLTAVEPFEDPPELDLAHGSAG